MQVITTFKKGIFQLVEHDFNQNKRIELLLHRSTNMATPHSQPQQSMKAQLLGMTRQLQPRFLCKCF